jgi:hypothetical protein
MWHLIKYCWLFVVHIHILIYNSCTLPLDTREQSWSGYRLGLSQGISGEIGQLCRTTVPYSFGVLDPHDLLQMLFSQTSWINFIALHSEHFSESFLFLFWEIRKVSFWSFFQERNEKEYKNLLFSYKTCWQGAYVCALHGLMEVKYRSIAQEPPPSFKMWN